MRPEVRPPFAIFFVACMACEPRSYLRGVVRAPTEQCARVDHRPVAGASVELLCPNEPNREYRVLSGADGAFEITVDSANFDPLNTQCTLRVRSEYGPFDMPLNELEPYQVATPWGAPAQSQVMVWLPRPAPEPKTR